MLVRPVIKRLFFLGKPRKKRLTSLARLMTIYIRVMTINATSIGQIVLNGPYM